MASARKKPVGSKSRLWLALTDVPRAAIDFTFLLWTAPFLLMAPRGDGHPVILLPGYMATDLSLEILTRYLKWLRYDVHSWELGQNKGPATLGAGQAKLIGRLEHIHMQTGRSVSLVGWSLGGTFARSLAQSRPDLVRQVIMLGSPLTGPFRLSQRTRHSVPITSIFSRTDGVVPWQSSQLGKAAASENIEVRGSHVGLGANAAVFWAVADRLGQHEKQWQPFKPKGPASFLFP